MTNDFYSLLKTFSKIRSPWLRNAGVLAFYLLRKRYVGLYLDPALTCNLKCMMCYFSSEAYRHPDRTQLELDDYRHMADAIFHRVLKLQIGCGAEPTMYKDLEQLVRIGKQYGVPYISMTTNGNLLDRRRIEALADAGLNEITLSVHGFTKSTYEYLMKHARFEVFLRLLDDLKAVKTAHPSFRLRVNYTVNEDNVEELAMLPQVFEGLKIDVLQVRPIQNLGDSAYKNFSLDKVRSCYDRVYAVLDGYRKANGTLLIFPTKENLDALTDGKTADDTSDEYVQNLTYVYAKPGCLWHDDFDYRNEKFEAYCRRTGYIKALLAGVMPFARHKGGSMYKTTKALNYKVK